MKRTCLALILITAALLTAGCSLSSSSQSQTQSPYTATGYYFNTIVTIQIYDGDREAAGQGCLDLCRKYEDLFSRTIDTSDVSAINNAGGAPVTVSGETADIIQTALKYSELTDGRFDITIAPVTELWNIDGDNPSVPSSDDIARALSHVSYKGIEVNGSTVTLHEPAESIDLGGIAKGYIADRLKEYLTGTGVSHALINLGGNVVALGGKPDGSDYTIGIQRPFSQEGTPIITIQADEWSVVSSGPYERYFKQNGKIYHHIMDTSTGYPVDNDLLGVTIISKESAAGDALSTGCFALGLQKGLELIDTLPDTYAAFITSDYTVHYSDGFEDMFHPITE